jgi:hypothetical protein
MLNVNNLARSQQTMLSQESDSFLDDGDDLVQAFLEQEAKAERKVKDATVVGIKRSRTRSKSPVTEKPHNLDVKSVVEKYTRAGSEKKRAKFRRSPSADPVDLDQKKMAQISDSVDLKSTLIPASTSSPIILEEPPVSWPPVKVPASEVIKQAHTKHRQYIASSSTSTPRNSRSNTSSLNTSNSQIREENQQKIELELSIHPSLTQSSNQSTLKSKVDEYDGSTYPNKQARSKSKVKVVLQGLEQEVSLRDKQGRLTEKGKRKLDEQVLRSLGQEGNAITDSDLYSR